VNTRSTLESVYDTYSKIFSTYLGYTELNIIWDNSYNINGKEGLSAFAGDQQSPISVDEYHRYKETVREVLSIILTPEQSVECNVSIYCY
jgi:hypothetical protein